MKKAILDEENILIGFKEVIKLKKGDVDGGDGDLITDGRYKWTGEKFVALGMDFPKPKKLPAGVTMEYALYLLMKSVIEGKEPPHECFQWVEWFEENLKKRQEETLKRRRGK